MHSRWIALLLLAVVQVAAAQTPPKPSFEQKLVDAVGATIKDSQADAQAALSHYRSATTGQGYGNFIYNATHDTGNMISDDRSGQYQHMFPDVNGKAAALLHPVYVDLNQKYTAAVTAWQNHKLTDHDLDVQLFQLAHGACMAPYVFVLEPFGRSIDDYLVPRSWQIPIDAPTEVSMIRSQTSHKFDDFIYSEAKATHTGLFSDRQAKEGQYLTDYENTRKALLNELISRLSPIHSRLVAARNKWGAAMWKYYDLALAKSSQAGDEWSVRADNLKSDLLATFTTPIESSVISRQTHPANASNTAAPSELADVPNLLVEEFPNPAGPNLRGGFRSVDLPLIDSSVEPLIQGQRHVAVGFSILPDVMQLRSGPVTIAQTWSIEDCFAIFDPSLPRLKPTTYQGSDSYTLMLYGEHIPNNASQLQLLKSGDSSLQYEILAYNDDIKANKLTNELAAKLSQGLSGYGRCLRGLQAQNFAAMSKMLLRVRLTPGVLPGRKTFTLNGADAAWHLDQGSGKAEMQIARLTSFDQNGRPEFPAATEVVQDAGYIGDYVRVEIHLQSPLTVDQIPVVLGRDGVPSAFPKEANSLQETLPAKRISPQLYVTDWIHLVAEDDARLDPATPSSAKEPNTIYLAVDAPQAFHATMADPFEFQMNSTGSTVPLSERSGLNLWRDALERAATADKLPGAVGLWQAIPDQDVQTKQTLVLSQVLFRNHFLQNQSINLMLYFKLLEAYTGVSAAKGDIVVKGRITLGDHAAMILMRDHFVAMMDDQIAHLQALPPDQRVSFVQLAAANPDNPINNIQIGSYSVHGAIEFDRLQPASQVPGLIRATCLKAFDGYLASIQRSRDNASGITDAEIDRLLALTGVGFQPVVDDLLPELVTNVIGGRQTGQWVPDRIGRGYVRGVQSAFAAIDAQNKLGSADTAVAIAIASLVPISLGAAGAKFALAKLASELALTVVNAVQGAQQVGEYFEGERAYQFAAGSYCVLGSERYNMAVLQRVPAWTVLLALTTVAGSVPSAGNQTLELMAKLSKSDATRVAAPVIRLLKPGNAVSVLNAGKPQERAALMLQICEEEAAGGQQGVVPQLAAAFQEKTIALEQAEKELAAEAQKRADLATVVADPMPAANVQNALGEAVTQDLVTAPTIVEGVSYNAVTQVVHGPVLPLPLVPGTFVAANGVPLKLEKLLSNTSTVFDVWKQEGLAKAIKLLKPTKDAHEIFGDILVAKLALQEEGIPFKAMAMETDGRYIIQDLVPNNFTAGQENFIVSDYIKTKPLTEDMNNAIMEMVDKMIRKNLAFEDFKLDAVYLERVNGKLVCGVVDVDRIASWNSMTPTMDNIIHRLETLGEKAPVVRAVHYPTALNLDQKQHYFKSLEEFWEFTFQRRRMVQYNPATKKWENYLMNSDSVSKVLPGFKTRGYLDLSNRTAHPPTATPGHSVRWNPWQHAYAA